MFASEMSFYRLNLQGRYGLQSSFFMVYSRHQTTPALFKEYADVYPDAVQATKRKTNHGIEEESAL